MSLQMSASSKCSRTMWTYKALFLRLLRPRPFRTSTSLWAYVHVILHLVHLVGIWRLSNRQIWNVISRSSTSRLAITRLMSRGVERISVGTGRTLRWDLGSPTWWRRLHFDDSSSNLRLDLILSRFSPPPFGWFGSSPPFERGCGRGLDKVMCVWVMTKCV